MATGEKGAPRKTNPTNLYNTNKYLILNVKKLFKK